MKSKNNYKDNDFFDNIMFLYNNPLIFTCNPNNPLKSLEKYIKKNANSINQNNNIIIGVKLNILSELFYNNIFLKWFVNSRKKRIIEYLISSEFEIKNILAVYPNIYMPMFCFNLMDNSSHRILINEILLPRKYSLTFLNRILFLLFSNIIKRYEKPDILVRNIFIIAKKVA